MFVPANAISTMATSIFEELWNIYIFFIFVRHGLHYEDLANPRSRAYSRAKYIARIIPQHNHLRFPMDTMASRCTSVATRKIWLGRLWCGELVAGSGGCSGRPPRGGVVACGGRRGKAHLAARSRRVCTSEMIWAEHVVQR